MEYQSNGDKCARRRAGTATSKLEREIADALAHSSTDDLTIAELKRQKLQLKDEMERLRCEHG